MPYFTMPYPTNDEEHMFFNIEIEVGYVFRKGQPGLRDSLNGKAGYGPPLTPDDPDEVEVTEVNPAGHLEVNLLPMLTAEEVEAIESFFWKEVYPNG